MREDDARQLREFHTLFDSHDRRHQDLRRAITEEVRTEDDTLLVREELAEAIALLVLDDEAPQRSVIGTRCTS